VKATVHLGDATLFARYNEVYRRRFRAPYPARATVGSDLHLVPGMMIMIDVIAYVGK
jgi:2-iminobutanoate/2-iminopropanoate deaminase